MNENTFGIRDGEVAVDLPERFDASLYFIGRIRTPWKERKDCPKNPRESDAVCTIELDPRWAPALKDVETAEPHHRALLDGPLAARPGPAGAAPLRRAASARLRCVRPHGPIRSRCRVARLIGIDGAKSEGGRARLPRRHAAPRHQALFRLDRRRSRGRGRLARCPAGARPTRFGLKSVRQQPSKRHHDTFRATGRNSSLGHSDA